MGGGGVVAVEGNLQVTQIPYSSRVVSTVVSQVLFGPFCTVEHIPTKSSLSIKKVPVKKESSHSKFFGQLCNSSTWWVTKSQKTGLIWLSAVLQEKKHNNFKWSIFSISHKNVSSDLLKLCITFFVTSFISEISENLECELSF